MRTEGAMRTGLNTSRYALDLKDEKDFFAMQTVWGS